MSRYMYRAAALTDPGLKRSSNQDFVGLHVPDEPEQLSVQGRLYVVADGVGGESKGEVASRYAVEKVLAAYFEPSKADPAEHLASVIRQAGNEIFESYTQAGEARMATTMVAALVIGDRLTVANVGDSRAYLVRAGVEQQISQDHSLVDDLVRYGYMSEEETRVSKMRNRITRSLGGEQNVEVDLFRDIELQAGDRIVLCSDGLTRYIGPNQTLGDIMDFGLDPEIAAQAAIAYANGQGGADNISVIVVAVVESDEMASATETLTSTSDLSEKRNVSQTDKTEPDLRLPDLKA